MTFHQGSSDFSFANRQIMDLRQTLEVLGWSKAGLARRLGLSAESVSRWDGVPEYAAAYLRCALACKAAWDEFNRED